MVPTESTDVLTSITEEGEMENAAPMQRGAPVRNSKPKLSAFPVLGKKKDSKEKNVYPTDKKSHVKETSKGIWNSISGGGDMVDAQQKPVSSDNDGNSSQKDEISMSSVQNSTETSDSRSQVTTDSLDMETGSRFAAMQVSSV